VGRGLALVRSNAALAREGARAGRALAAL